MQYKIKALKTKTDGIYTVRDNDKNPDDLEFDRDNDKKPDDLKFDWFIFIMFAIPATIMATPLVMFLICVVVTYVDRLLNG